MSLKLMQQFYTEHWIYLTQKLEKSIWNVLSLSASPPSPRIFMNVFYLCYWVPLIFPLASKINSTAEQIPF